MKNHVNSFKFAFNGIREFFNLEFNARIHSLAAIIAVFLAILSDFQLVDWVFLALAIMLVFLAEMFNTAIEILCNRLIPEEDDSVKKIKDISAGAVLIASLFSIIIALVLFIPKWI